MPFHSLSEFVSLTVAGLAEPLLGLGDPSARTYAPFLLAAAILAGAVWLMRRRRPRSLLAFLFPRNIWLHRSALLDYRLTFARAVLRATLLWPLAFSEIVVAVTLASWLWAHVGRSVLPSPGSGAWVSTLYGVSVFVAEDFARYVIHRLAHRVPPLWELHKVHHSAEVMTPWTVQRAHPLESVLMRAGAQLAVGVVTGLFLWLFPGRLRAWEILGVYGLSFLWTMLGANLRHSHVWLSYGPTLEHVFISPAQHQIHHGDRLDQYDTNFGSALAIWDWAFGSLRVTTRVRPALRFGLPPALRNHRDTVTSAIVDPLRAALRAVVRGRSSR